MKEMLRILIFILSFLVFSEAYALQSDWSGIEEAKVRIISPFSSIGENKNIFLGLEYKLKKGWKTYWHTPGEGGFPQSIDWKQSKNIESLEILWPTPIEFEILGLKSIGYKEEVVFPLKIKLKNNNISSKFFFELNYLTCKDICLPGKANLALILPSGSGKITKNFFKLEKYLSKIPIKNKEVAGLEILNVVAESTKNSSLISINAKSKKPMFEPKFFLDNKLGLPIVDPIYKFSSDRKKIEVNFFYENISFNKKNIDLSILFTDRNTALEEHFVIKTNNYKKINQFNNFFFTIILIAMLGGLILNVMPCVLPVISLKFISVLKNKDTKSYNSIRSSFFITALGIITSFVLLSIILIIIKSIGVSIGWGMQFQQPIFLMIISLILFLFFLNLLGLFNFYIPPVLNNFFIIKKNNSLYNDFFNGFFATILATPCSAPFVGTAVSAAFTQSYILMISIFFFMGIGMSAPYILAGLFPQMVKLLPKPGPWMIKLKYILAFLIFGTILWIGNILLNHFNYLFIFICIFLFSVIFVSIKYIDNFKNILILVSILAFFSLSFFNYLKNDSINYEKNWLDFNNVKIEEIINQKKIVFVDITADWCATCQYNKIKVINSKKIKNIFVKNQIILIRGDWTKPNEKIEKYLNKFNRFGIPFNIIYGEKFPDGIILSELLTKDEIIKAINQLK